MAGEEPSEGFSGERQPQPSWLGERRHAEGEIVQQLLAGPEQFLPRVIGDHLEHPLSRVRLQVHPRPMHRRHGPGVRSSGWPARPRDSAARRERTENRCSRTRPRRSLIRTTRTDGCTGRYTRHGVLARVSTRISSSSGPGAAARRGPDGRGPRDAAPPDPSRPGARHRCRRRDGRGARNARPPATRSVGPHPAPRSRADGWTHDLGSRRPRQLHEVVLIDGDVSTSSSTDRSSADDLLSPRRPAPGRPRPGSTARSTCPAATAPTRPPRRERLTVAANRDDGVHHLPDPRSGPAEAGQHRLDDERRLVGDDVEARSAVRARGPRSDHRVTRWPIPRLVEVRLDDPREPRGRRSTVDRQARGLEVPGVHPLERAELSVPGSVRWSGSTASLMHRSPGPRRRDGVRPCWATRRAAEEAFFEEGGAGNRSAPGITLRSGHTVQRRSRTGPSWPVSSPPARPWSETRTRWVPIGVVRHSPRADRKARLVRWSSAGPREPFGRRRQGVLLDDQPPRPAGVAQGAEEGVDVDVPGPEPGERLPRPHRLDRVAVGHDGRDDVSARVLEVHLVDPLTRSRAAPRRGRRRRRRSVPCRDTTGRR